jgi:EpsI family protein
MKFLNGKYARALTLVLMLQAAAFYAIARRPETTPPILPLQFFPDSFDGWQATKDIPTEPDIQAILRADDLLNRVYVNPARTDAAFLFIAFFKTQRYGQSPHSPKNCLPGSGWEKLSDSRIPVTVPGWASPIVINRYVVEHGEDKDVTLYWYHDSRLISDYLTRGNGWGDVASYLRVIASEFAAKLFLVADSIRYHRSDTALVRVITPVHNNDVETASRNGIAFVQSVFPRILHQLPL